jgi:S1-C subfamily serine protease
VVAGVEPGSTAADANIKQHDILLRWNNESIAGSEELINIIQKNGGATAKVVLFREGKRA